MRHSSGGARQAWALARPRPLDVDAAAHGADIVAGAQTLTAPMAGTIIKVNVAEGDIVEPRQTLVVLGAMKMEHAITAPHAGRVRRVLHARGRRRAGRRAADRAGPAGGGERCMTRR